MAYQAQNTDLNVTPGGIIPVVHVSQHDVGRVLTFSLQDGNGSASLPSGTTARIEGTKPSMHGFQYNATISGNVVTVSTEHQMTIEKGTVECKIVLINGQQTIGTALFLMEVEQAGLDDNVDISETVLPVYMEAGRQYALRSEAYAIGTREGVPVTSGDDAYHNNSKYYAANAAISEQNASASKISAAASELAAKSSEDAAAISESNSEAWAVGKRGGVDVPSSDVTYENNSKYYAEDAADSARAAAYSASTSADAEAWAVGQRDGQDVPSTDVQYHNNSKYYADQTREIAESFSGALRPKGTCTFANLPTIAESETGDMWNISDQFTTTADFREGAGQVIPVGSNIYLTIDYKWDVLAGTPVSGVKGNAETDYRTGNVNVTFANLGSAKDGRKAFGLGDSNGDFPITVSQGGTGKTTHTSNAILTGDGTNAVKNVATAKGALYATSANGAASFGTLPVAEGGTGATTLTSNGILKGNGTSAIGAIATASGALYATAANGAATFGKLPIAQGGTNATTAADARTNLGLGIASTYGVTGEVKQASGNLITSAGVYSETHKSLTSLVGSSWSSGAKTITDITTFQWLHVILNYSGHILASQWVQPSEWSTGKKIYLFYNIGSTYLMTVERTNNTTLTIKDTTGSGISVVIYGITK